MRFGFSAAIYAEKFRRLLFLVPPLARQPVRTFLDNRVIDGR